MALESALTAKERTLVGIGAAIATGCQSCTAKYVEAARAAGACERSIRLAIETALAERHNATEAMADWARTVQGAPPVVDDAFRVEKAKNTALIASVAAHSVNSTATLDAHLMGARQRGWSVAQIEQALGIGRSVAKVAASKIDERTSASGIGRDDTAVPCCEIPPEELARSEISPSSCGCGSTCGGP